MQSELRQRVTSQRAQTVEKIKQKNDEMLQYKKRQRQIVLRENYLIKRKINIHNKSKNRDDPMELVNPFI